MSVTLLSPSVFYAVLWIGSTLKHGQWVPFLNPSTHSRGRPEREVPLWAFLQGIEVLRDGSGRHSSRPPCALPGDRERQAPPPEDESQGWLRLSYSGLQPSLRESPWLSCDGRSWTPRPLLDPRAVRGSGDSSRNARHPQRPPGQLLGRGPTGLAPPTALGPPQGVPQTDLESQHGAGGRPRPDKGLALAGPQGVRPHLQPPWSQGSWPPPSSQTRKPRLRGLHPHSGPQVLSHLAPSVLSVLCAPRTVPPQRNQAQLTARTGQEPLPSRLP